MEKGSSDNLDRLLDAAVATYSAEEPRPGLTQRVIANTGSIDPSEGWLPNLVSVVTSRMPHVLRLRRWLSPAYLVGYALVLIACASAFWSVEHARHQDLIGIAVGTAPPQNSPVPEQSDGKPMIASEQAPSTTLGSSSHARSFARAESDRMAVRTEVASKPEVFPTPSPLTAEERALVALATNTPEEVKKSLAESALQSDEPIRIAAVHIEPLTPLTQPSLGGTFPNATP